MYIYIYTYVYIYIICEFKGVCPTSANDPKINQLNKKGAHTHAMNEASKMSGATISIPKVGNQTLNAKTLNPEPFMASQ